MSDSSNSRGGDMAAARSSIRISMVRNLRSTLPLIGAALGLAAALGAAGGCGSLEDLTGTVLVRGEPFVVSGTFAIIDRNGRNCPVWYGDNGVSYHLFQSPRVPNDDFDRATVPGVRSRLEIAPRNDLFLDCQVGTIVEVQRVLQVVD